MFGYGIVAFFFIAMIIAVIKLYKVTDRLYKKEMKRK
jgi:hypothetical protein